MTLLLEMLERLIPDMSDRIYYLQFERLFFCSRFFIIFDPSTAVICAFNTLSKEMNELVY